MCDMGEDESVEHVVVLECEKYERDRMEMMQEILTELGHSWDERVEKRGKEWMVLLLGLCRTRIISKIPGRELYLGRKIMAPQWPLTELKIEYGTHFLCFTRDGYIVLLNFSPSFSYILYLAIYSLIHRYIDFPPSFSYIFSCKFTHS